MSFKIRLRKEKLQNELKIEPQNEVQNSRNTIRIVLKSIEIEKLIVNNSGVVYRPA